ncbi:Panacea domain-containing protein [Methylobacterium cerastii]|uniref:Panacea domain-containing protein n=1 Tax=Methylobacterium cerastii TaxID=932741 RepID=UPI001EE39574|nr:Panacea domain-containing protein [Methylobacterium cerastii]
MFDKEKFKALIHYAIARVEDPKNLGAIKLNKILWYVDGNIFIRSGLSLTGARYVKQPMGPVPKAMLPILQEMQRDGLIRIDEVSYYGKTKKQYTSLVEPRTASFSSDHLEIINHVVDAISKRHTGASISEATHGNAWKLAEMGEEIPFHAAMIDDLADVSDEDAAWALRRMEAGDAQLVA